MGTHPIRGLVTADDSLLYVSDFGAGRGALPALTMANCSPGVEVGEGPDARRSPLRGVFSWWWMRSQGILRWCALANPVSLFTLFPAGRSPNDIVVKAFLVR